MKERIQKQLDDLRKARADHLEQANRQQAAFGGAIQVLTALLEEEAGEPIVQPNGSAEVIETSAAS